MAEAELQFDGKPFVPSKIAAEATGYTQDYIGQLARGSSILAHRVGGLWYVNLENLIEHKKDSEAYVPEPPLGVASHSGSIVSFDGKEYIASKRAAQMTGYAQDYVGQLARAGKIQSRQIAGRWYVSKDDLRAHKKEKDALLAAVQAESVGVQELAIKKEKDEVASPLYTYLKEEKESLPRLAEKSEKAHIPDSRFDISDSNKKLEKSEEDREANTTSGSGEKDAIHHIAIRAMHHDVAKVSSIRPQTSTIHDASMAKKVSHGYFAHEDRKKYRFDIPTVAFLGGFFILGCFFVGFYMTPLGSVRAKEVVVSIYDDVEGLLGVALTYKRK